VTELRQEVKSSSPFTHQIASTFFAASFPAVDVSVVGGVLVTGGAVRLNRLDTTDVPAGGDRVGHIFPGGAVGQVSPVVVSVIIVEVSDLHTFRARPNVSHGDKLMNQFSLTQNFNPETTLGGFFGLHLNATLGQVVSNPRDDSAAVFINEVSRESRYLSHEGILS
jgi:hypothetical protein